MTGAATDVGGNGATLNATVNPIGSATSYRFEYGTDTELRQRDHVAERGLGHHARPR